eukprot:ANDGO_03572.mRNA.1 hypothetical protein
MRDVPLVGRLLNSGFLATPIGQAFHAFLCFLLYATLFLYAVIYFLLVSGSPVVTPLWVGISCIFVFVTGFHLLLVAQFMIEARRYYGNAFSKLSWVVRYYSVLIILMRIVDLVFNAFSLFSSSLLNFVVLQIDTVFLDTTVYFYVTRIELIWHLAQRNNRMSKVQLKWFYVSFSICMLTLVLLNLGSEFLGLTLDESSSGVSRVLTIVAVILHTKVYPFIVRLFVVKLRYPDYVVTVLKRVPVDAFLQEETHKTKNHSDGEQPLPLHLLPRSELSQPLLLSSEESNLDDAPVHASPYRSGNHAAEP